MSTAAPISFLLADQILFQRKTELYNCVQKSQTKLLGVEQINQAGVSLLKVFLR